ncbi:cytochrome D ubiquinol oxidase subunit II [Salipiger sp. CCB-MM3]|uniref:LOG family protein n=1 Tax=Salipiger sp. CCB-MM3 TaxID=1792508 RepID=UPI00080AB14E|nr:TIGR00730 family Rossman fold protein [Salipiger sp. CCB-MM3]ANT61612.1 cytochrome D ubiquinol oxidase subunit II [Salipiger sp. CCB-MM3]
MADIDPQKPHPAPDPERRVELPGCAPKPASDDRRAPDLVSTIMDSPSYREGDRDVEFLDREDMRGVRLLLDYQKPETLLQAHGIAHAIVVFGATRIPEPARAQAQVADRQAALDAAPGDPALTRALGIARRVADKSRYYDVARAFGRIVGEQEGRHGNRLVVVTGGGPGIMEAANRGSHDAQARTVGLNITLPHEQYPNPYLTPDLCFRFHYFALRKLHFLKRARALVVFPGGYGTLDELFETLTLIQTRKIPPVPVVLVGEAYWRRAFDADFLVDEGVIDPEDRDLFWYAEEAEEIWEDIQRWYRRAGREITSAVPEQPCDR